MTTLVRAPKSGDFGYGGFATATLLGSIALWFAVAVSAQAATPTLRHSRTLDIPARTQEEIVAVPFDTLIFKGSQDDKRDIRILDAAGNEVPYLIERAVETRTQKVKRTWQGKTISLKETEAGGLQIEIAIDAKDEAPEGIRILTPLKDFQRRVTVEGSESGAEWKPIAAEALIFDYSRYMDLSSRDVALGKHNFRRLRINIDNVTAAQESQLLELTRRFRGDKEDERVEKVTVERRPFRIDRIELWSEDHVEQVKGEKVVDYPVAKFSTELDDRTRKTVVAITSNREPLTGFILETPSRNFSRRAVVMVAEKQGVQTVWREVGSATLARIDFRDLKRDDLAITFPEQRREQYRIEIENGDNPELDLTGLVGRGNVYHAMFLAAPQGEYHIAYGSDEAEAPSYETVAINAALGKGYEPIVAKLGDEAAGPEGVDESTVGIRGLLNNTWLLGSIVVVLVAVLAWVLYRAGSRIDQVEE